MLLSTRDKSVLAIKNQASKLKQYEQKSFPFSVNEISGGGREDERLWCDLLCSSSQPWCLGNDCGMWVLTIPMSSAPQLEFMKLDLEAMGNLVWLPKLEDNTSPSRKNLPSGAGFSVISVANLLYDAFTLGCDNGTYTSHFEVAFYWLNVNIIAIVYYGEVSHSNWNTIWCH